MSDCFIRNGVPLTTNDHYTMADLDLPVQKMVMQWIADNIFPGGPNDIEHHGHLKHQMEYDIGVYVSGNQMKDAMLQSGFRPIDPREWYWEFNVVSRKESILSEGRRTPVEYGLFPTIIHADGTASLPEPIADRTPFGAGIEPVFFQRQPVLSQQVPHIILANGNGLFVGEAPENKRLYVPTPLFQNRIVEILIDDLGVIEYDPNRDAMRSVIKQQVAQAKVRTMHILGHVAEAVIVHRCNEIEEVNERWLRVARFDMRSGIDVSELTAIGTGFKSTEKKYRWLYNPDDTQRDIIWRSNNGDLAMRAGGTRFTGTVAGIQVKASWDGIQYLRKDLKEEKYCVPVVYFPLNDDFEQLLQAAPNARPGIDLIDVRDVDIAAYNEVCQYYPLIYRLVEGSITPDDIINEARSVPILRNALLSNVLQYTAQPFIFM